MLTQHLIDEDAAVAWFRAYVRAINGCKFHSATEARRALMAMGLGLLWWPGRSDRAKERAAREAAR